MKVGDKVRVKSWEEILKTVDDKYYSINLDKCGGRIYFDRDSMYQYTSLTGTISNIDNYTGNVQIKFSKDCSRYWHPCWLDLIPEKLTVDKNCSSRWLIFCMILQYLSGNCPNPSIFKYMFTPHRESGGFDFSDFKYDFINLQEGNIPFPDWPILNLPLDEAYTILEHCYTYGSSKKDLEFFTDDISTIIFCGFLWANTPEGDIYWNSRLVNYKYPTSEEKLETQIKIENYENKLQRKKSIVIRGTVPEGSITCGRKRKTSIAVGYLSNSVCIGG